MKPYTLTKTETGEIEIRGEVPVADFMRGWSEAVKRRGAELELPGFRRGHAPEHVVVGAAGEEKILLGLAEEALGTLYPQIVRDEKIDALGRPAITITKLAKDNPLGYIIRTAVKPEFALPDWRPLAQKVPAEAPVDDKPESVWKARDKRRLKIMEGILGAINLTVPPVLAERETDRLLAEMKSQLEQAGLKFDDYLTHIKKDEAALRTDLKPEAEKNIKTGLVLQALVAAEKVVVTPEELEPALQLYRQRYPKADEPSLRAYVADVALNEKVWQLLEKAA